MQFLDPSGLECKRVQILVLVNLLDSKTESQKSEEQQQSTDLNRRGLGLELAT